MANKWTRGAAHRHTTSPVGTLGINPVARELHLTSCPTEGRRLGWPEQSASSLCQVKVALHADGRGQMCMDIMKVTNLNLG